MGHQYLAKYFGIWGNLWDFGVNMTISYYKINQKRKMEADGPIKMYMNFTKISAIRPPYHYIIVIQLVCHFLVVICSEKKFVANSIFET